MTSCVDQRRIPGITRLYSDYLYEFARVGRFYSGGDPYSPEALAQAAAAVKYPPERRGQVTRVLLAQNNSFGAGPRTRESIGELQSPDCVAVVSGQQLGLFGGPLLGVHKAMTAVRIAESMRQGGIHAVPVFWLASQDHDLEEINHTWVLDRASEPVRVAISHTDGQSVGRLVFDGEIAAALDAFVSATGRAGDDITELRDAYRPGETFSSAFARLLSRWFAPWGLVLIDPLHSELAAVAAPLYDSVVAQTDQLSAVLEQRDQELQAAGYHVQVTHPPGSTLLFVEHNGARVAVRRDKDGALMTESGMQGADLQSLLREHPERVSPSALLRPVLQDWLLPTAVHVAGPAEIAYLAQSDALYHALGVKRPLVHPRASLTLLDARAARLLEKYQMSVPDVWTQPVDETLARRALPSDIEERLQQMQATVREGFQALTSRIAELDATLADPAKTAEAKIEHQFDQLAGRIRRSFTRRNDELRRHAAHLTGTLYPQRTLQERLLSAADWKLRAPKLIEVLYEKIAPDCRDHQLIAL